MIRIIEIVFALALIAMPAAAQRRLTQQEYIEKYKHLAIADQEVYGIPASVKMAQALLESDSGNSRLATQGNNHFGIKCKSTWRGETIRHDDDAPQECFRKYGSVEESFRDHSDFLNDSPRYQVLFTLDNTDYKAWARGLKECGYATNPQYAERLIALIERLELYALDGQTVAALPVVEPMAVQFETVLKAGEGIDVDNFVVSLHTLGGWPVFHHNGAEFVIARRGDTYEAIAAAADMKAKRLRRYNAASPTDQPDEGMRVFLQRVRSRRSPGFNLR
jgi:hypothetical protein